jgi:hypothetical protein
MELKDIQSTVSRIEEILNPHDQMQEISTLLESIYSRIEGATSVTALRKITAEITKNREFLQSLQEIADITVSVSNADGPDYDSMIRNLNILVDDQEFEIYISKYEVYFNALERLDEFKLGIKEFLTLPYIPEDLKNRFKKMFGVLIEAVSTRVDYTNWYELLKDELSSKKSVEDKIILISNVVSTLGAKVVESLKSPQYHPHYHETKLLRTGPVAAHLQTVEEKVKRIFGSKQGLINATKYSILYDDVNVGANIIFAFNAFMKVIKRTYTELLDETETIRRIGQTYESKSQYNVGLTVKNIDSNTLSQSSSGLVFSPDLSSAEAQSISIAFSTRFQVNNSELNFLSYELISAYPVTT